jgi:ABC-2 type transport system ATP-binding protein
MRDFFAKFSHQIWPNVCIFAQFKKNEGMDNVILQSAKLTKTYLSGRGKGQKTVEAVKGVDLEVRQGEIFGFLGPNGAGKSTTLKMLTTLLAPTSGAATIVGHDLLKHPDKVRACIGYVSQAGGTDTFADAYENLILQARLYGVSQAQAAAKARDLVTRFQMTEFANRTAKSYSGGQKRRLDLALGIVHQPTIVFLDEPTTGLDPQSRAYFWDEIVRLKNEGMTIFLTTHYLEEADNLCDRVAIIDHGTVVALDTTAELKRQTGGECITMAFNHESQAALALQTLGSLAFVQKSIHQDLKLHLYVHDGGALLAEVLRLLDKEAIKVQTIGMSRPSLDDVFLQKTGRSLRDEGKE